MPVAPALLLFCSAVFTLASENTPPVGSPPEKKESKIAIQDRLAEVAGAIASAKAALERVSSPSKRITLFDEMIGAIQKAVAEVSDGGETMGLINTALKQNEDNLREYKNKKSDSNISPKTREAYQRLEEKFKQSNTELQRARASLETRRKDLELALKMAQEQKILFIDMMQADIFLD